MNTVKTAVVVVGPHKVGKSKTINHHFKVKLKISSRTRFFYNRKGYISSQTWEEKDKIFDITQYQNFHIVVLATRPASEPKNQHAEIIRQLGIAGFRVYIVELDPEKWLSYKKASIEERYYDSKGTEIFDVIKKAHPDLE